MRNWMGVALCSAFVAACGGGGGDAGAPAVAPVPISSTNQQQVARAAASSVTTVASTSGIGGVASSGAGIASLGLSRQIALALGGARKSALSAQARPLATEPIGTMTCPAGGSIALTYTYANANGFTPGDSLGFTFTNCKTTSTDNTNGTMSIAMNSFAETNAGMNFAGTMTLNLTAIEGSRTTVVSGSVGANYTDLTTTSSRIDLTIGSGGLTGSVAAGGVTETITYVSGFTISQTDTSTGSSVTVNGAIDSSVLAGRITLQTTTPIVQLAADAYPSSGVVRVTGANGSAALLTVLNATQLQVQLDAGGDGTYETTTTYTWAQVLPNS